MDRKRAQATRLRRAPDARRNTTNTILRATPSYEFPDREIHNSMISR